MCEKVRSWHTIIEYKLEPRLETNCFWSWFIIFERKLLILNGRRLHSVTPFGCVSGCRDVLATKWYDNSVKGNL